MNLKLGSGEELGLWYQQHLACILGQDTQD